MYKYLLTCLIGLFSLSSFASDIRIELDGANRVDSWTSRGNMALENVASDGKTYRIRLSCISAANNRAQGFAIGEIHVYKGSSHVGSKATLDYDECLSLYDGLKQSSLTLTLDWDQKGYDDLSTGKATFFVTEL